MAINWTERLARAKKRRGEDEEGLRELASLKADKKEATMSRPLIVPMKKAAKPCSADCTCTDCKKKMAAKVPSKEVPGNLKPALTPANTPEPTPAADISPMKKKAYLERQGDFKPALRTGLTVESPRKEASVQRDGEYKPERREPFNPQLR